MHKDVQIQASGIALASGAFREAMRSFASTVSIISCASDGHRYGMSATAVTSLSIDPPSLLICINKATATHRVLSRGGQFCVNVLRSSHSKLSQAFSGQQKGQDRFRLGNWQETDDGLPYLVDAQANLFCEIVRVMDYTTHTIFIAHVYFATAQGDVDPLLYQDGKYAVAHPVTEDHRLQSDQTDQSGSTDHGEMIVGLLRRSLDGVELVNRYVRLRVWIGTNIIRIRKLANRSWSERRE
jgi:flavin reductase